MESFSRCVTARSRAPVVSIASRCDTVSAAFIQDTVALLALFFTTHSESGRMTMNLFSNLDDTEVLQEELGAGMMILRKFVEPHETKLLSALDEVLVSAPLRRMITPGGFYMSVAM